MIAVAVLALAGCREERQHHTAKPLSPPAPAAMPVAAVKVARGDVPLEPIYPAVLSGSLEIRVQAQVGGILKGQLYEEGKPVTQGAQLFQIDEEPYSIALDRANGALAQAASDREKAKLDYDRMAALWERKAVSRKDYDDAVAAYGSAKAAVQVATAGVRAAEVDLEYAKVRAPISGLTSIAIPDIGALIQPGDDLTGIVAFDPLFVDFSIPAAELAGLKRSIADGDVTTDGPVFKFQVIVPHGVQPTVPAQLIFRDNSQDPNTASVRMRASLPNPDNAPNLLPGQFVRVKLLGTRRANVLSVPATAVLFTPKGPIVYVIGDDGTVKAASVKVESQGSLYIVREGLNGGETVAAGGLVKLRNGMKAVPRFAENASQGKP